jgi:hypothetical protein
MLRGAIAPSLSKQAAIRLPVFIVSKHRLAVYITKVH